MKKLFLKLIALTHISLSIFSCQFSTKLYHLLIIKSTFLAISVFLGVNATPVSAESGLSEAMHLDAGSDLFDVLLFILLFPSIIFTSFVLIVETIVLLL